MSFPANLLVGTSSWSSSDWLGPFYPASLRPGQFIEAYARFIGDQKAIEAKTRRWDKLIEDKTPEMSVWVNELKKITDKGVKTYAFFNNHYAGFAPGSVKQFEDLWDKA